MLGHFDRRRREVLCRRHQVQPRQQVQPPLRPPRHLASKNENKNLQSYLLNLTIMTNYTLLLPSPLWACTIQLLQFFLMENYHM
jgi:hypothetical protein